MAWPSFDAQQQQQQQQAHHQQQQAHHQQQQAHHQQQQGWQQGWQQGAPQSMWHTYYGDAHGEQPQGGPHYGGPAPQSPMHHLAQVGPPQPQPAPPQGPVGGKGDFKGGWGVKGSEGVQYGYNDSWSAPQPRTMGKGRGAYADHGNYGRGYAQQHGLWTHAVQGFGKGAVDGGGAAAGSGNDFVDPYSWGGPVEGQEWHADGAAALSRDVASGDRDCDSGGACAPKDECPTCCTNGVTVHLECSAESCPGWRACYVCAFRQDEEGPYSIRSCPLCRGPIARRTDERAQR